MLISSVRERTLRTDHLDAPLWAIRCRSAEERARTGRVARAVRILNGLREARGCLWVASGGPLQTRAGQRLGEHDYFRDRALASM